MKNVLLVINSTLALGCALVSVFFAWKTVKVQHTNDELADDKAALLTERRTWESERQRIVEELQCARTEKETAVSEVTRVREEKESLGRSLVSMMDSCARLTVELKQKTAQLASMETNQMARVKAALAREEEDRAEQQKRAAAKLAQEKAAIAARAKAAKAKAEAARIAALSKKPLRVEDLKPLNPKMVAKSDQESLDELLELAAKKLPKDK